MTRAFGDLVASSVGVIAQPDIVEVALAPEHQYLVLCSDGIYEFMSNDDIIRIVHAEAEKGALPAAIAKLLVGSFTFFGSFGPLQHVPSCAAQL